MEAPLESDHSRPLRVGARELDRVLDRLGARVEEARPELARDRDELDEALRERDVVLVRDDREVRVGEALGLVADRLDDAGVRVADVHAADPAREVHEAVAVHVREHGSLRLRDHERQVDGERLGDDALLAREDLAAARARDLRPDLDRPGRRHGVSL